MIRKTLNGLTMVAVAATMMVVGCGGPEDVKDLQDTWTSKEQDLNTKLAEVKAEHAETMTKWTTVAAAAVDSAAAMDRAVAEQSLQAHGTQIGEIEAMIAKNAAAREEAIKAGKRADVEAAWNTAKTDYEGAMAKLDELDKQHDDIAGKMDSWGKGSAVIDTGNTSTVTTPTQDTIAKK